MFTIQTSFKSLLFKGGRGDRLRRLIAPVLFCTPAIMLSLVCSLLSVVCSLKSLVCGLSKRKFFIGLLSSVQQFIYNMYIYIYLFLEYRGVILANRWIHL